MLKFGWCAVGARRPVLVRGAGAWPSVQEECWTKEGLKKLLDGVELTMGAVPCVLFSCGCVVRLLTDGPSR